jgi:hypothetical protein
MKRVKRYRLYYENQYTTEGGYVDLTLLSLIWNLLRGYYKNPYQVRYTIFRKIIILKK